MKSINQSTEHVLCMIQLNQSPSYFGTNDSNTNFPFFFRAKLALDLCREKIIASQTNNSTWPLDIPFRGLSHFGRQVVYIEPAPSEGLSRLHDIFHTVEACFAQHGIVSTDRKATFTPHLTLMKLSKAPRLRRLGIKEIHPALFSAFENHDFGVESVTKIQLCSMLLPKKRRDWLLPLQWRNKLDRVRQSVTTVSVRNRDKKKTPRGARKHSNKKEKKTEKITIENERKKSA